LSCALLPPGTKCSFNPNPLQLYGGSVQSSTLTIQTSTSTPAGTYTIEIKGAYANLSHLTSVTLTVQ